jgi:hypothetical protein
MLAARRHPIATKRFNPIFKAPYGSEGLFLIVAAAISCDFLWVYTHTGIL